MSAKYVRSPGSPAYEKGYEQGIAKGRADALRELREKAEEADGYDAIDVLYILDQMLEALAQKPLPMPTPTYEKGLSDLYQGPIDSGKTYLAERGCNNCRFDGGIMWGNGPCGSCSSNYSNFEPKEGAE